MSNKLKEEAENILKDLPTPDADANTMKEAQPLNNTKRGRGRPSKSGNTSVTKKQHNVDNVMYEQSAKAINTVICALVCTITGTAEALPDDDRAKIMDNALTRYFEIKNMTAPPELILLSAYSVYFSTVATNKTVQENVARRFGFLQKIQIVNKLKDKFLFLKKRKEDIKK